MKQTTCVFIVSSAKCYTHTVKIQDTFLYLGILVSHVHLSLLIHEVDNAEMCINYKSYLKEIISNEFCSSVNTLFVSYRHNFLWVIKRM